MAKLPSLSDYEPPVARTVEVSDNPYDDMIAADAAVKRSLDISAMGDGATVARANVLARKRGIPAPVIESDLQTFETQEKAEAVNSLAKKHPGFASWSSEPRNAAMAADDYDALGLLGKTLYGAKSVVQSLGAGTMQATSGLWGAIAGLAENAQALEPQTDISRQAAKRYGFKSLPEYISGYARTKQREGQVIAQEARPDVTNWVGKNLLAGVKSVPLSAASVGVSLLGSPAAGVGMFAASAGGNEYIKARDTGLSPQRSAIYGATQGTIEYVTEKIPVSKLAGDIATKTPILKTLMGQLAAEIPGEQLATLMQDFTEWVTLNPDKTLSEFVKERPGAAAETLVATIGGVGGATALTTAVDRTARAAVKITGRLANAKNAEIESARLDQTFNAASASKLRQGDPEAFKELMAKMAEDTGTETLYVPAEAMQAYMQSDAYKGEFDDYADDIAEGIAKDGDVVIPMADAVTTFAGSTAWDAIKDDVRLTPGGDSKREALSFNDAMADVMDELATKMGEQERAAAAERAPREMVFDSAYTKLTNAGYTPSMARTQAELVTRRAEARATMLGRELTGNEYDVEIREVLPERLARAKPADNLDMLIATMRRKKDAPIPRGPSLVKWIAQQGGITDPGGDLKAMGLGPIKGIGAKGQRKLIRESIAGQGSMLGADGMQNSNSPDNLAMRAWQEGYFPDFAERPEVNVLLDAISEELAGRERFSEDVDTSFRDAADQLRELLEGRTIDPDKATRKQISEAMDAYVAEQAAGLGYDQSLPDTITIDGVTRSTVNSNGQPIAQTEEGVRNFWNWFGESKVVDEQGRPLVVYHGTDADISIFGSSEDGGQAGGAYWFGDSETASAYADQRKSRDSKRGANILPVYLSMQNPFVFDAEGRGWNGVVPADTDLSEKIEKSFSGNKPWLDQRKSSQNINALSVWAKKSGYDGVITHNVKDQANLERQGVAATSYAAFDPTQIKSVNNRGAFDPADARILYQSAAGITNDDVGAWASEVEKRLGLKAFNVWLSRGDLKLNMLIAGEKGQGLGTKAMEELTAYADLNGKRIVLSPAQADDNHGTTSRARLVKFYKRFGFHENKGRKKDYAVSEGMIREPIAGRSYNQEHRGRAVFQESGKRIIELLQLRDQSTFIHESGHIWLEELREDAALPEAPERLRNDWKTVEDWFSANGYPIQNGIIPEEAHEMWARGIERYVMEGVAPSKGLRKVMEIFKVWMTRLYKSVDSLKAPITPEIRDVMNRLIATEEEIALAAEEQQLQRGFDTKPDNMTDSEWSAYEGLVSDARSDARDALLVKVMNAVKRRVTKEYKERAEVIRQEVAEQVGVRPEFVAMGILKTTPMDTQVIVDRYGIDAPGTLLKQVPPVHKKGGANPDDIAEIAGFGSGDDMIRMLISMEAQKIAMREAGDTRSLRKATIEDEVNARMLENYGDPFTDGSIEEEALATIHNDKQGEVLAAELRVLARSTQKRPTPYRIAKAWAERAVAQGVVKDVASRAVIQQYRKAAQKSGRLAQEAMLKGDMDAAFDHKQAQMLNNAFLAEATRVAEEIDKAVARMSKLGRKRTFKSIDQDYLEQAQTLLEQVDLKKRTQTFIDRQGSFEAWAKTQEANGVDVIVPQSFEATLGVENWSRLTVEKLLNLDAVVSQIIHLGKWKQTLIDNKERRDFDAVVGEVISVADDMGRKAPSDLMEPSFGDRLKSNVMDFDAALLKMETIFDWMDNGNPNGAFNRIVFEPIATAEGRSKAMQEEYHAKIKALFEKVGIKQLARWQDKFTDPVLTNPKSGNLMQSKRVHLIVMALNMGNEGNRQRLIDGYEWDDGAVMDVLNRELTKDDWDFVQSVWDTIEGLWPEMAAMERRVNGVEPEKVDPSPIETPHGTYKGGYYPAVYDATKDYSAEERAAASNEMFGMSYTRATTRSSSTKARADKVNNPILLDLGVLNRHIQEVIHDITHREAIMQADKFLSDRRVMRAMDDIVGVEARKQSRPWLQYVANQWAHEKAGNEGAGKWIGKARSNTTVVGMGFRATTIITQIAGYSNSFEYVGAKWVTPAIGKFAAELAGSGVKFATFNGIQMPPMMAFAMERSPELRGRMDNIDRDIRSEMNRMMQADTVKGKVGNVLTAGKRFAFHGIGYADRLVVVPTWVGMYNRSMSEGMTEQQAIYAADKAVRLSQGSSSAKDIAAIARGTGPWGKALTLLTMFYSYVSTSYNRKRSLGRDVARASAADLPDIMARAFWLIMVPPILAQVLGGNGPEEDEDWGVWAFKEMMFDAIGAVPVVRDLGRPLWDEAAGNQGFDYQMSPIQRAGQTIVFFAGDVGKVVRGEDTKRMTKTTLETVGYTTGLLPGQIATSTQFLVDVGYDEYDPQTVSEWYRGLTKGKIDE